MILSTKVVPDLGKPMTKIGDILLFILFDPVNFTFVKIFGIVSFLSVFLVIAIFPFFSYSKYWIFLSPFLALFMAFTPRLSITSFFLVYIELILKSSWISLP